jgi:hypothetical protein
MTPILYDMVMLTGLPIDETLMASRGGSIDKDTLYDCLLERVPPVNAYRGDYIKLIWLDANF